MRTENSLAPALRNVELKARDPGPDRPIVIDL
jgi:hypothetical protein